MSVEGPSIIAPKLKVYWVHLHCLFAVVADYSLEAALGRAVEQAGDAYDPMQEFRAGEIKARSRPETFVALRLSD